VAEDLNSLRTLLMLYETRSVTVAAERLSVSQPTVSYTLSRLRRRFGDDLFRREGNTLVPTSRARRLYDALHEPLSRVDQIASQASSAFDPVLVGGEVVLALSSLGEITWLPIIFGALERSAPTMRLRVMPLDIDAVEDDLVRGNVDLAITMTVLPSARLWRQPFYDPEYVAVTHVDHPLQPGEEGVSGRRFVVVAGREGHVFLRDALYEHGLAERVVLSVHGYAAVPHVLETTDLVALLPRYFAEVHRRYLPLAVSPLPWPVPNPRTALYSRREESLSPAQAWLRTLVLEALRADLPQYERLAR
jgi:DNA-binding transcriptional LysR family regulator